MTSVPRDSRRREVPLDARPAHVWHVTVAHVDLRIDDLAAVTALVERLGGARLADHEEEDFHWRVMRDPEGNEFCLMPSGQDG
ncbi:MAG: VOC family protein [Actinomycetota bacterium]